MILQRIIEFDQKFGEGLPAGYRRLQVHHILQLTGQGELRAVIPVMEQAGKKVVGRLLPVPDLKRSGSAPGAALFVDLAKYVLARGAEDDPKDYAPYRERFLELARSCANDSPDQQIQTALKFLETLDPNDERFSAVEPDHRIAIEVDGKPIADLPDSQHFWAAYVRQKTAAKGGAAHAQCLVTGELCEPVRIFAQKVVGVPNTNQGRADLISFNADAFCSYGLDQSLNSPISPEAAEGITRGLNQLIGTEKHRIRLGPVVYVAWCRDDAEFDFWKVLEDPQSEHVSDLLTSPVKGGVAETLNSADFFVLSLSGANSRIIVRDYHETTLDNAKANLGKWFQRLQLVGADGIPVRPMGVYRLAASLYRDASKEMPAHVPTALLNAALAGRHIPEYILGLAVKRNLAMQGPFYATKAKTKAIDTSRLALIKAVLTPNLEDNSLNQLNFENPNPAYHCGRMLAVLEAIQRVAIPGLNATLTDRYYGAACASPATVFGNLLKDATSAHLPKLRKNRPGAHYALDQRLQEVAGLVGEEFPRTLTLKDQALFALGYYHQKAHDTAEARKNKELKELADATTTETEDQAE